MFQVVIRKVQSRSDACRSGFSNNPWFVSQTRFNSVCGDGCFWVSTGGRRGTLLRCDVLGLHWILDAVGCEAPGIAGLAHLRSALEQVPARLGLTVVGEPKVFWDAGSEPETATSAGIILIAESHLSIHVRPHLKTLHVDLFSCAPFDTRHALRLLREFYQFQTYDQRVIERGVPVAPMSCEKGCR